MRHSRELIRRSDELNRRIDDVDGNLLRTIHCRESRPFLSERTNLCPSYLLVVIIKIYQTGCSQMFTYLPF
jgi:hypothetical protein